MSLALSTRAAKEIKRVCQEQKFDPGSVFLRLGVKGGGCSGFQYDLDIVDIKGEHDAEFESEGIKIICDLKSLIYLNGTELDFQDELSKRGFVFNNPNAGVSCGCGQSFAPGPECGGCPEKL